MPHPATGVRRRPVQQRSIERFERMLDICARLLEEVGVDALTTREVAERADVPIGTLYQFFDGKAGLLRQLALRNLERLMERLRARAAVAPVATWSDLAVLVLEEFVEMRRTVPGFAVVDFEDNRSEAPPLLDQSGDRETTAVMADWIYALGTRELGLPEIRDREYVLPVAMESAAAAMKLPFRHSAEGDPRIVAEIARLLRAYFDEVMRDAAQH
ncbi:TetR family transcriptional regulator [Spirillospora sp. CA-253888]